MRLPAILTFSAVLGLAACSDSTGPRGATITVKADQITCSGGAAVTITIDGESRGSYSFSPGAEWVFPVEAGEHSVQVQGEEPSGGFVNFERDVDVPDEGNFTIVMTCNS